MGLFGGGNSTTQQTTNNYDQRSIEETSNEGDLSGNQGTINYTGDEAFGFAEHVIDAWAETSANSEKSNSELYATISQQQSDALTGGQSGIIDSLGQNIKWVAIAALGYLAVTRLL